MPGVIALCPLKRISLVYTMHVVVKYKAVTQQESESLDEAFGGHLLTSLHRGPVEILQLDPSYFTIWAT
ncbi:hypothetical protein KIL84_015543, partial [Mauremys mutica]